ncbi:MAG TPA: hypothetical protein VKS79_06475 [Gemmataceae bacterium]|nr:hypothetical protein [Gemmataceae bacterium]
MPVSQKRRADYWFIVAAAFFLLLLCPSFMVFTPWTTAITLAEANKNYPGQVDPNWRGVSDYHGRPHEWNLGTKNEHPLGFATCCGFLAIGAGGFVYCAYRCWRAERASKRPTNGQSESTTFG